MVQGELFDTSYKKITKGTGKVCIYCKEEKTLESFQTHLGYKDKLDIRCKKCIREQARVRQILKEKAPPKSKKCDCCGLETEKMVLDHCHETLNFRGWLCTNCNMGIGKLGDDINGVKKALYYLQKYEEVLNEANT